MLSFLFLFSVLFVYFAYNKSLAGVFAHLNLNHRLICRPNWSEFVYLFPMPQPKEEEEGEGNLFTSRMTNISADVSIYNWELLLFFFGQTIDRYIIEFFSSSSLYLKQKLAFCFAFMFCC